MKALAWNAYGEPDAVLAVQDVAKPTDIPAGSVLLRVSAASLNPVDKIRVTGGLKAMRADTFPAVLGYDVSGTIESLGEGVTEWTVGDAVAARTQSGGPQPGTIAEFAVVHAAQLAKKPENVGHNDAASLGLAGQTALQALRRAGCKEGSKVFISGGAGGVGTLAIQIAKILGAATVATTASPGAKTDLCKSLGADVVINYREAKFEEELKDYDVCFDTTGESEKCAMILKSGGKTVTVAGTPTSEAIEEASGSAPNFVVRSFLWMGRQSAAENAHTAKGCVWNYMFLKNTGTDMAQLLIWTSEGKIKTIIPEDQIWPLSKAKEAADKSFSGRAMGKVIVTVP